MGATTEVLLEGPSSLERAAESNIYDDSIRMLWASKLVYSFADLLQQGRSGNLDLSNTFPPEVLDLYKEERLDCRDLEDGQGLSITTILKIVEANVDNLKDIVSDAEHVAEIIEKIKTSMGTEEDITQSIFLKTFASIDQATQCVYGVLKDVAKKRITVVFRGSVASGTRDWLTNFTFFLEGLHTPKLVKDSLEGSLKERILVHRGFYRYIFDNSRAAGDQRYDMILDDIKPYVEDGYKIYVTGHSLGGALSSLLAFKLAGSDKEWIPKPVTCISFASPFVGSSGFRTAFTLLERMGMIRYLRVNTDQDVVPALLPMSLGWKKRFMKHVGLNLRLTCKSFILTHPNTNGCGIMNAVRNAVIKPWCFIPCCIPRCGLKYHLLPLHEDRMEMHRDTLQTMNLEDLYDDEKLFGTI